MRPLLLALFLCAALATESEAATETCLADKTPLVKKTELLADGPGLFGISVAVGRDLVLVGAPGGASAAGAQDKGTAFLFSRDGQQVASFSDQFPGTRFGWSVALSANGQILAIGAPLDGDKGTSAGAVWLFERNQNGGWMKTAKLTGQDTTTFDAFGFAVSLDDRGQTLVVGAPLHDAPNDRGNSGAVYVFENTAGWIQSAKLTATDAQRDDQLGTSVAIDGLADLIAAGAPQPEPRIPGDNSTGRPGRAYLFQKSNGPWSSANQISLAAQGGKGFDAFGFAVALEAGGKALAVGAPGADLIGDQSGAVYLFQQVGAWPPTASPLCGLPTGAELGFAVSIDGETLAVGARRDGDGAVYLFNSAGSLLAKLLGNDGKAEFGRAVAVRNGLLAVGAPLIGLGAAFLYELEGLSVGEVSLVGSIPGKQTVFTAKVTNHSEFDLSDTMVGLTFDPSLTGVVLTCAPNGGGASCTCQAGCQPTAGAASINSHASLSQGTEVSYQLKGTIPSGAAIGKLSKSGTLSNSVAVDAQQFADPTPSNNRATKELTLDPRADLKVQLAKNVQGRCSEATDSVNPVAGCDQIVYSVTVSNQGPSDATGVTVTDILPADVKLGPRNAKVGKIRVNGRTVIWTVGPLVAGKTENMTLTADVLSNARGTLSNTAAVRWKQEASGPNLERNTALPVEVKTSADLNVTLSRASTSAVAGSEMEAKLVVTTLIVSNMNGPSDAVNAKISLLIPDNVEVKPPNPSPNVKLEEHELIWTIPSLPKGTPSSSLEIKLKVPANWVRLGRGILHQTVSVIDRGADEDPNETDNHKDLLTDISAMADLELSVVHVPSTATAGKDLGYTATVTNRGPSDATGIRVSGGLPDGFDCSVSSASTDIPLTCDPINRQLTGTIGVLPAGEGQNVAELTAKGRVAPDHQTSLSGSLTVTANENDPGPSLNRASLEVSVQALATLTLALSSSPRPAVAGDSVTYVATLSNTGPSTALNLVVTFSSTNFNVTGIESSTLSCDVPEAMCSGSLGPASQAAIKVTGSLSSDQRQPIKLGASTNFSTPGDKPSTELAIPVVAVSDITAKLNVDPENGIIRGAPVTFTLTVHNNGPSDANLVQVEDRLPTLLDMPSLQRSDCSESGLATSLQMGDLSDIVSLVFGKSVCYKLMGRVKVQPTDGTSLPSPLFNLSSATPLDARDPDLGNNTALVANSLSDTQPPRVTGAMSVSGHFVCGGEVVYRVALANNTQAISGVTFTDQLPTGLKLKSAGAVSGSLSQVPTSNQVNWSGDILPLSTVEIVIVAEISAESDQRIENQGEINIDGAQTHDPYHGPYQAGAETKTGFDSTCPTAVTPPL
ncbi:MAG TPA: hypothetical protein VLV54_22655 [Thermoanaerobaculia bacterium]|nr:hypothetical protein [Thermoanaerobaculia bacterium]